MSVLHRLALQSIFMIAPLPNQDPEEAEATRQATATGLNVFSRVLSILVLSAAPILIGYYIDQWLGWRLFIFVGCFASVAIAFVGLFAVANQANRELLQQQKRKKKPG